MLYIASPYTHPTCTVRRARAYCATKLTGELMRRVQHDWLFSPIAQGHPIAAHLPLPVASNHGFWMQQCHRALAEASGLWLLPLPGWDTSAGVEQELDYCHAKSIPVTYLDCRTWAMQHLRVSGHSYRTPAEQEAKRIWQHIAGGPRTPELPNKNWRLRELAQLPLLWED